MARFKLLGKEIQGQEANQKALSLDQQHAKSVTVVYETDDASEVASFATVTTSFL
jgi:2-polyprenyl-3-methyl-5-hydroxy-6-metoxy-1,4-benzoquinol methylase